MAQAKSGDTVQVHYTGTLSDGSTFDSSEGREPLEFTLGEGGVIPGFENAVIGMAVEESKEVTIPCAEAYGEHNVEMVQEVPRDALPGDMELELGMPLQAEAPDGEVFVVTVTSLTDDTVILDGNHPLAGQDLTFNIQLVGIA